MLNFIKKFINFNKQYIFIIFSDYSSLQEINLITTDIIKNYI